MADPESGFKSSGGPGAGQLDRLPAVEALVYRSNMASTKTLNARNLEALGPARLAELLIEISAGDAVVKRRLRLELAGTAGVSM